MDAGIPRAATSQASTPSRDRRRSVVLAFSGHARSAATLDWAAAEAAVRDSALQIVHVHRASWVGAAAPAVTLLTADSPVDGSASALLLDGAVTRARGITSAVSGNLRLGDPARSVLREARHGALTVVGRGEVHRPPRVGPVTRRIVRSAPGPVVVVSLADGPVPGPCAGQVVLLWNGRATPATAAFAFEAARRRGIGLTLLRPARRARRRRSRTSTAIEQITTAWQVIAPELGVRQRSVPTLDDHGRLVAEVAGAALVVIGCRRGLFHRKRLDPTAWVFVHAAACPVAVVGGRSAN